MIFTTPELYETELLVVEELAELRRSLRHRVAEPRRWVGSLRRLTFARAVQGSNSIEGYHASLDDVLAAVEGEEPLDADSETRLALAGYRDAMTYVLQLAGDDHCVGVDLSLLKSWHFMMLKNDLRKNPGKWRPGAVFVRNEQTGKTVYEGAYAGDVPELMAELVDRIDSEKSSISAVVRAAMAHLNLVMIHPFSDGNGRMARCLQTFVMAQERIVAPVFSSIEEYLGRNTQAYYDALAEVGQGEWNPDRDARLWVRFCLTAHLRQAKTLIRRVEETESLWGECENVAEKEGLPERMLPVLFDAAMGLRIRNAVYRSMEPERDISEATASRDLKTLVDKNLLVPHGERRGRFYTGADALRGRWRGIRDEREPRSDLDPFGLDVHKAS